MASTSKDENRYENGAGAGTPGKAAGSKLARKSGKMEPDDASAPLSDDPADIVNDEELIEMLEQLSDTIDTAQTILTENQLLGPDADPEMPPAVLDAPALDPPAPHEQPEQSARPGSAGEKPLSTAASLGIGLCLGIGVLAAFWLYTNGPGQNSDDQLSNDSSRPDTAVIAQKTEAPPEAVTAAPEPEATVTEPETAAPEPETAASEPDAAAPEPMAAAPKLEATAPESKQADETASIPTPKEPSLADATAMAQIPDAKPAPEATNPEPTQPDFVAAIATPPAASAPPKPAVDTASNQPIEAETAEPKISAPEPVPSEADKPQMVARTQPEAPPAPPPLDAGEEARLLAKGRGLSRSGDIASARLVYEHVATRGSADAMYALAQTYDPKILAQWKVIGIAPDPARALEWYTRAARLGHDAADARANELER